MRRSNPEIIVVNGVAVGVSMPGNYCAEHEWGIGDLTQALGNTEALGLDGRTSTRTEDTAAGPGWFWLGHTYQDKSLESLKRGHDMCPSDSVGCGWCSSDCAMYVEEGADPALAAMVQSIVDCVVAGRPLVVMLGGRSGPFGRSGLLVCPRELVDKVPTIGQAIMEADSASAQLKAAWEPVAAMLKEQLKSCKISPYAQEHLNAQHARYPSLYSKDELDLSRPYYMAPKELLSFPPEGSSYPFMVWLNPSDQELCEHGWYTVEQLLMMKDCKGPVIEKGKVYQRYTARDAVLRGEKVYPRDYEAICTKCGYVHHNGNARGRHEMLTHHRDSHGYEKLVWCPTCGAAGDTFVFSDDDPEHWHNKKKNVL